MARVLVIDDSQSVRKALERVLLADGHVLRTAATGEEGFARLAEETPDLVFCDLVLPDIHGFEIGRFIRKTPGLIDVPLVFISALLTEDRLAEARAMGAHAFVSKPFAAEEISKLVAELVPAKPAAPDSGSDEVFAEPVPESVSQVPVLPSVFSTAIGELQLLPGLLSAVLVQGSAYRILASSSMDEDPAGSTLDRTVTGVLAAAESHQLGRAKNIVFELEALTVLFSELQQDLRLLVMLDGPLGLGRARYFARNIARSLAAEAG